MAEAGQGRHVEVQRHVVGNGALIAPLPVSGEGQEAIENTGFLAGSWLREALIEGRQNSFSRMMRTSSGFTGSSSFACIRSEEHTYELQTLMRISYAVSFLKKKKITKSYIEIIK